ncbi:MAG: DMT family transporter [Pseudomonadota bacterium]
MSGASRSTPPGPADYGLLVTLAFIWGSAFLLSKIAVAEVPPVTITLIRQVLAGVLLTGLVVALGRSWFQPSGRDWIFIVVCALTGTVLPFTLINWGVEVIDSGLAAILMGLMPLVVIVLAHFVTDDEKLSLPKVLGVVLGLVGLAVLFWPQLTAGFGDNLMRQVAVLGAAIAYAVNALSTKQLLRHPPLVLMAYITLVTWLILFPGAFMLEAPMEIRPSRDALLALLALGVLPTAVGALLMFAVIERQGASFFGQINLLVPVAGVLLGAVFLGERPGWNAMAALVIIVFGVVVARLRLDGFTSSEKKESSPS